MSLTPFLLLLLFLFATFAASYTKIGVEGLALHANITLPGHASIKDGTAVILTHGLGVGWALYSRPLRFLNPPPVPLPPVPASPS
ncbi:hypothetical protein GW17_00003367 [Ensete ventricosum]|nr:hypothetical protein GW17_00003367 [Ensete ventricosum]